MLYMLINLFRLPLLRFISFFLRLALRIELEMFCHFLISLLNKWVYVLDMIYYAKALKLTWKWLDLCSHQHSFNFSAFAEKKHSFLFPITAQKLLWKGRKFIDLSLSSRWQPDMKSIKKKTTRLRVPWYSCWHQQSKYMPGIACLTEVENLLNELRRRRLSNSASNARFQSSISSQFWNWSFLTSFDYLRKR